MCPIEVADRFRTVQDAGGFRAFSFHRTQAALHLLCGARQREALLLRGLGMSFSATSSRGGQRETTRKSDCHITCYSLLFSSSKVMISTNSLISSIERFSVTANMIVWSSIFTPAR